MGVGAGAEKLPIMVRLAWLSAVSAPAPWPAANLDERRRYVGGQPSRYLDFWILKSLSLVRPSQCYAERWSDHVAASELSVSAPAEPTSLCSGCLRAVQPSAGAAGRPENLHQFALLSWPISAGQLLSLCAASAQGSCAAFQVRSPAANGGLSGIIDG